MSLESFKTSEVKSNSNKFDPDRKIDIKHDFNAFEKSKNIFNPDKKVEKYYTTYEERIKRTPNRERWKDDRGEKGVRGESVCLPSNPEAKAELAKFGKEGIEYKNGLPDKDFEKCSEVKVEIDMTSNRYGKNGNFPKADKAYAEKWNKENKDGRNNWEARDVEKYRKENKMTWHECADKKHCLLVPREIHEDFKHIGGHAECERKEAMLNGKKGVTFDG